MPLGLCEFYTSGKAYSNERSRIHSGWFPDGSDAVAANMAAAASGALAKVETVQA
jgi:hypothetical protein